MWAKPLANQANEYTGKTVVAGCSSVNAKFMATLADMAAYLPWGRGVPGDQPWDPGQSCFLVCPVCAWTCPLHGPVAGGRRVPWQATAQQGHGQRN